MKDFEFLDLDEFLDVADGINTPFMVDKWRTFICFR